MGKTERRRESIKIRKIAALSLISFISLNLTASYAWWWLYPGAQVIDIGRLEQSIQVTAQALLTAQQTLQNYQNKLTSLLPTTVLGGVDVTRQSAHTKENEVLTSLTGPMNQSSQQATNPSPDQDNSASAWKVFLGPADANLSGNATALQNAAMRRVATNANYDAFNVMRMQNDNLQTIGTEINQLAGVVESGNLGQRQVAIAERVLITKMMMNNLYAEVATDIATETKTKEEITKKMIGIRQMRYLQMGVYDPYNRTTQDNTVYPATTAIGYPRF